MAKDDDELRALVTDHAVVRYVERILGIDIKGEVVNVILGDGRADMVRQLNTGFLRIGKTPAVLKILHGQVITVVTSDSRRGHSPQRKKRREKSHAVDDE